eukprot:NODE_1726_length_2392_cov_7.537748.p2 GENE.NODE_1726_length_2392_cov_7.537748~~NODE_1726_length_2392_cov_7.537748.p2  ORF type:complete len:362 (+),score=89.33 NODE_1726_length_2392_cov_7.537748:1158-2243(+)
MAEICYDDALALTDEAKRRCTTTRFHDKVKTGACRCTNIDGIAGMLRDVFGKVETAYPAGEEDFRDDNSPCSSSLPPLLCADRFLHLGMLTARLRIQDFNTLFDIQRPRPTLENVFMPPTMRAFSRKVTQTYTEEPKIKDLADLNLEEADADNACGEVESKKEDSVDASDLQRIWKRFDEACVHLDTLADEATTVAPVIKFVQNELHELCASLVAAVSPLQHSLRAQKETVTAHSEELNELRSSLVLTVSPFQVSLDEHEKALSAQSKDLERLRASLEIMAQPRKSGAEAPSADVGARNIDMMSLLTIELASFDAGSTTKGSASMISSPPVAELEHVRLDLVIDDTLQDSAEKCAQTYCSL